MKARPIPPLLCPYCEKPNVEEVHNDKGKDFVGDTFSHYKDVACDCELPTPKKLTELGFIKVNNSMWRKGNIVLQNTTVSHGESLADKILSMESAYAVWINKKYHSSITSTKQLIKIL